MPDRAGLFGLSRDTGDYSGACGAGRGLAATLAYRPRFHGVIFSCEGNSGESFL